MHSLKLPPSKLTNHITHCQPLVGVLGFSDEPRSQEHHSEENLLKQKHQTRRKVLMPSYSLATKQENKNHSEFLCFLLQEIFNIWNCLNRRQKRLSIQPRSNKAQIGNCRKPLMLIQGSVGGAQESKLPGRICIHGEHNFGAESMERQGELGEILHKIESKAEKYSGFSHLVLSSNSTQTPPNVQTQPTRRQEASQPQPTELAEK